jgi:2-keto-4-pentenoate hydratase
MNKIKHPVLPCVLCLLLISSITTCTQKKTELEDTTVKEMADILLEAREANKAVELPSVRFGEYSLNDAYRVQIELNKALSRNLGEITGYKVAFATHSALEKYQLEAPVTGAVFQDYQIADSGSISHKEFFKFHIETEIVFTLSKDIRKEINTLDSLLDYVESVHVGFDIADERYNIKEGQTRTISDFVANGSGASYYVAGKAFSPDSVNTDTMSLRMFKNGEKIYEGKASNIMGSPWNVLLSVVQQHYKRGQHLDKGEVIISGKVAPPYTAIGEAAKGLYRGECGSLGSVHVHIK